MWQQVQRWTDFTWLTSLIRNPESGWIEQHHQVATATEWLPDLSPEDARHLPACLLVLLQAARLGVRMVRLHRALDIAIDLPVAADAATAEAYRMQPHVLDPWLHDRLYTATEADDLIDDVDASPTSVLSIYWEARTALVVRALEALVARQAATTVGRDGIATPGARATNLLYLLARCDTSNVRRRVYRWYRRAVEHTPYAAIDSACPFRDPLVAVEGADNRRPGGWPRGQKPPPPKRPRCAAVPPVPVVEDVEALKREADGILGLDTVGHNSWKDTAQETTYAVLDACMRGRYKCPLHAERARLRGWTWPEPQRAAKEHSAAARRPSEHFCNGRFFGWVHSFGRRHGFGAPTHAVWLGRGGTRGVPQAAKLPSYFRRQSDSVRMAACMRAQLAHDLSGEDGIAPLVQAVLSSVPGACCIAAEGEEGEPLVPTLVRCVLVSALARFVDALHCGPVSRWRVKDDLRGALHVPLLERRLWSDTLEALDGTPDAGPVRAALAFLEDVVRIAMFGLVETVRDPGEDTPAIQRVVLKELQERLSFLKDSRQPCPFVYHILDQMRVVLGFLRRYTLLPVTARGVRATLRDGSNSADGFDDNPMIRGHAAAGHPAPEAEHLAAAVRAADSDVAVLHAVRTWLRDRCYDEVAYVNECVSQRPCRFGTIDCSYS